VDGNEGSTILTKPSNHELIVTQNWPFFIVSRVVAIPTHSCLFSYQRNTTAFDSWTTHTSNRLEGQRSVSSLGFVDPARSTLAQQQLSPEKTAMRQQKYRGAPPASKSVEEAQSYRGSPPASKSVEEVKSYRGAPPASESVEEVQSYRGARPASESVEEVQSYWGAPPASESAV
jgi:hypothetical protein